MAALKQRTDNLSFKDIERDEMVKKYYMEFFNDAAIFADIKSSNIKKRKNTKPASNTIMLNKRPEPPMFTAFDKIAEDHREAFLGRSKGILNSFNLADQKKKIDVVLRDITHHLDFKA